MKYITFANLEQVVTKIKELFVSKDELTTIADKLENIGDIETTFAEYIKESDIEEVTPEEIDALFA